jgi:hypothetical protein
MEKKMVLFCGSEAMLVIRFPELRVLETLLKCLPRLWGISVIVSSDAGFHIPSTRPLLPGVPKDKISHEYISSIIQPICREQSMHPLNKVINEE